MMLSTVWGVVREGQIELLEDIDLPEGSKVLVTLMEDDDSAFWWQDGQVTLDADGHEPKDGAEGQLPRK
jgi:hypothetical protein